MKIVRWQPGCECVGASVAAIGVFDGVHIGHQALIRDAITEARARGVNAVAVTFDRDPDQVVTPDRAARQLLSVEDKYAFLGDQGLDAILLIPFNPAFADVTPEAFVDEILIKALHAVAIHVGFDFRFGRRAAGSVETLECLGKTKGFEVRPHSLLKVGGLPVTATRIRGLVAAGDVAEAAALLGRPTRVEGVVKRGRGEGANLGFATANIEPAPYAALPAPGVYAARAILGDGTIWPSAVNVGLPPTFPGAEDVLEAHLIGYEGDLYGLPIKIDFLEYLRGLEAFGSLEALTAQITEDVRRTGMCYTSAAVTTTPA